MFSQTRLYSTHHTHENANIISEEKKQTPPRRPPPAPDSYRCCCRQHCHCLYAKTKKPAASFKQPSFFTRASIKLRKGCVLPHSVSDTFSRSWPKAKHDAPLPSNRNVAKGTAPRILSRSKSRKRSAAKLSTSNSSSFSANSWKRHPRMILCLFLALTHQRKHHQRVLSIHSSYAQPVVLEVPETL